MPVSPGTTTSPLAPAAPAATAPARPDWAPEGTFDAKTGLNVEAFGKHYTDRIAPIIARDAAEQSRRSQLPPNAESYLLELPKDLKFPEGVEYSLAKIDDPVKGPSLKSFREWAHKTGLNQAQVSEALAQLANYEIASTVAIRNAAKAEREALGATVGTRVDAILQWVGASYPSALQAVASTLATKAQVEMFESIIGKITSQGGASFRGNGREPPQQAGRLSDEQIKRLTPAERLDYSRQWDQATMPAWRDPRG